MDVFFYEAFEEEAARIKSYLPSNINAGFTWKTIQEYGQEQPPARLISVRTQSAIPHAWKNRIDAILSRSTGYDHLKRFQKASGSTLPMGYLPLYCHRAVAEQALLLMLSLARKLPSQMKNFDHFHRDGLTGGELMGKTLAIVGVGNIGAQLVEIGRGLGMKVLPVDIDHKFRELKYAAPEEALSQAHFVVCAMNLTEENEGYFNYPILKQTPAGAFFINVSRGELSVSEDLLALLEEGHLAGIGLDVYEEEKELAVSLREGKPSENSKVAAVMKLAQHPQVILTPHNAFNTTEGVDRKSKQSVEQTIQFLKHGEFVWKVPE